MKYVDPTGAIVSLAGLDDTEIHKLLEELAEATGNEYGVDSDGNLALIALGDENSQTATELVDHLINDDRTFEVKSCNSCGIQFAGADKASNRIYFDFADFGQLNFGNVTPGSFGLGVQFLHEGLHHLYPDRTDPSTPGVRGFFVDRINQVRQERGFDLRDAYGGDEEYGKVKIFFEAKGWRAFFGIRKKVTYPYDAVARGPGLPP